MTAYGAAVSEHEDTIETKLAELRKRLTHLSGALDVDPRAIEILWLQDQVEYLARAVVASTQSPKPQEWVMFPSGQCVPAELVMGGYPAMHAAGFRWDGNEPVFPAGWPKTGAA